MPKRGKKYSESKAKALDVQTSSFEDAVKISLESSYAKFDETVDVAVRLGVDPRHADQMIRGTVVLPNGLGKEVKVLVFAKGEKEKEAQEAGAEFVGNDDLIEKIKEGWFGFDKAIATPDMMGTVRENWKTFRPSWFDAQCQNRYRDIRCGQSGHRTESR
jgi:large subunit ribosomal protein L1